jgi:hypothetical protein
MQIRCTIPPGAGSALVWTIYINGNPVRAPTTSYEPPVITGLGMAYNASIAPGLVNPAGGDCLLIQGSGFGAGSYSTFYPQNGTQVVQASMIRSKLQARSSSIRMFRCRTTAC